MKKFSKILVMVMTLIFMNINVKAASLSISASNSSPTVGSSVIITIRSSSVAGNVSITSSNGSVLSGGTSSVWIDDGVTKTYTFKANAAGTATVTLTPIDTADYSSATAYTASKSVTVTVKNKPVVTLSTNNALSSLSIEGVELSPTFSQDITEYSVTLKPETSSVNINASVADGTASISGAGTREVTDGDNRLEVVVTAENGSIKTYVINAKVEEYNPITVKVNDKDYTVVRKKAQLTAPNNYTETTVKINDEDIPAFTSEITKYTLVALKDVEGNQSFYVYDNGKYTLYNEFGFGKVILYPMELNKTDIPNGYIKTKITYNDKDIVAYKIKENSKYALIYGMNVETGETHIYMYDSKEDTVQIYNTEETKVLNNKIDLYFKIIVGVSILSFILLVALIIIIIKKKDNKKNKANKKDAKLIEDSIIENNIDYGNLKRKELSKKELRKKAREDKKKIKQENKKNKKSIFVDKEDEEIKVEKIDLDKYKF